MKIRIGIVASVVCVMMVMGAWQVSLVPRAMAGPEVAAVAVSVTLPMGDEAKYVGSKKCKMCHNAEYKSWEELAHATALETLMPGKKAEAKTKHGLDPAKDYTNDETCLACHTTGYGKEGGYFLAEAGDAKAAKKAAKLAGVGCEACHGAGGSYVDLHKEILKSKRKYKLDEMLSAGLIKPTAETCTGCHNDKSPTFESFDFEAMKDKGVHEHSELKQLEG